MTKKKKEKKEMLIRQQLLYRYELFKYFPNAAPFQVHRSIHQQHTLAMLTF